MAWYSVGTVAVTNGSATVTGSNTQWDPEIVLVGDAFLGPDGAMYEISAVNSATQITLARTYGGSNGSGQSYEIVPTRHTGRQQYTAVKDLIQTVHDKVDPLDDWQTAREAEIEASLSAAQAGLDTLAGDLEGVVADQMYFPATVDPDEANPTNVRGGTFTTLAAAISAAPSGAYVVVTLAGGKTHPVDASFWITSKTIVVVGGPGGVPVLLIGNASNGTTNAPFRMNSGSPSSIRFTNVNIEYAAKADAGLPWSASPLVSPSYGTTVMLSLYGCTVTGHAEAFLSSTYAGTLVLLNLGVVTLDGVSGVQVSLGTVVGSKYNVSLLNGAAIQSGGTPGTNVFIN